MTEVRAATFAQARWLAAVLSALAMSSGCKDTVPQAPQPPAEVAGAITSNLSVSDYAGSRACARCHGDIHARFVTSPMHRMTRHATGSHVRAPFDGQVFHFKGDTARMEQHEGQRYMRLDSKRAGQKLYLITKVIGGRFREDFVGLEVTDIDGDRASSPDPRGERVLPVSWLLFANTWRYKGYSVMVPERSGLMPGTTWRKTCIFCHNTFPQLSALYDDLEPTAVGYQGATSDRLLSHERRWRYAVTDAAGLVAAVADEVERLGAPRPTGPLTEVLQNAAQETRRRFDEEHLVEVGIGCESCHNGAREHAESPLRRPRFEPKSPFFELISAGDPATRAEQINRTCLRCHTVLFSQYPHTWEGGRRKHAPGGSNINSGEARDFLLGGCSSAMSCTTCHDPHGGSDRTRLDELATVAGNGVCTTCHEKFAASDALAAHTHHSVRGEGSACLSCHMPRKNMGLAYYLTRYHRIGSPNDHERVEKDRPLECSLCHTGHSVRELVETMERWWGGRFDRQALQTLYGRLDVPPLSATLARGKAHEKATAVAVLGQLGTPEDIDLILPQLENPYPLVRYFARHALEQLSGAPVPVDVEAPREDISAAVRAWRRGLE